MRSKEQIAVLHDLFSQINERLDIIGETSDAYFLCQCVEILKQQGATIDAQATRITELEAQLEAAKKDAERYRWLRQSDWMGDENQVMRTTELDVAIDAAIAEGKA